MKQFHAELRDGFDAEAFQPTFLAISAALWQGKLGLARELQASSDLDEVPATYRSVIELHLRALAGPPWTESGVDLPNSTSVHNERALLRLLAGDLAARTTLLVERHRELDAPGRSRLPTLHTLLSRCADRRARATCRRRCRRVAPLLGRQPDPPLPGLWTVHRAITLVLLAERERDTGLARAALALLDSVDADVDVRAWIARRAERVI